MCENGTHAERSSDLQTAEPASKAIRQADRVSHWIYDPPKTMRFHSHNKIRPVQQKDGLANRKVSTAAIVGGERQIDKMLAVLFQKYNKNMKEERENAKYASKEVNLFGEKQRGRTVHGWDCWFTVTPP